MLIVNTDTLYLSLNDDNKAIVTSGIRFPVLYLGVAGMCKAIHWIIPYVHVSNNE